jgi:hypothetical protein
MESKPELEDLLKSRSDSPLSAMLNEPPTQVPPPVPLFTEPAPVFSLSSLFNGPGSPKPDTPKVGSSPVDDDDEPYIPLTAEEIKVKAESKAEMWAAMIGILFAFVNKYLAYQKLQKGDRELIDAHDTQYRAMSAPPDYEQEHPYHGAKERWDNYNEALKNADQDARLNDVQVLMLRRAIEADMKAKNKRGQLQTGSIAETLFEIALVKATVPLMQLGMMGFSKLTDKALR